MRLFYKKVFGEMVDVTTERYTNPEVNLLLGSPETLVIQVRGFKVAGTSPTLTIRLYRSDDGVDWNSGTVILNGVGLTAGSVYFNMLTATGGVGSVPLFGGHMRLGVQLGGTNPSAQIELVVCGRGESRSAWSQLALQ